MHLQLEHLPGQRFAGESATVTTEGGARAESAAAQVSVLAQQPGQVLFGKKGYLLYIKPFT